MNDKALTCAPETVDRLVRDGDPEAMNRIVQCYGDCLKSVGVHRCATCTDAEDAVQDALLSATEHLGDFRGEGALRSWLTAMVSNACHRMRRGRKNDPSIHTHETPELASNHDPELSAMIEQQTRRVLDALEALPEDQQKLFTLSELEGWTAPELGQAFGLTPGAIRTRLTRIRQHLRKQLA